LAFPRFLVFRFRNNSFDSGNDFSNWTIQPMLAQFAQIGLSNQGVPEF
jgi:hypothetical protein